MKPPSQCDRVLAVLADNEAAARFFSKVEEQPDGCWRWTAGHDHNGYGRFTVATRPGGGGRSRKAHCVLWEWVNGPIGDGLELDHLCRVPSCVNPDHLEPVTHAENIRRSHTANPRPLASRCRRGHAYTPENTMARKDGTRGCRQCSRERQSRWRVANRQRYAQEVSS